MNLHFLQKKHHFGIRKFSIGVVSVALAISFSVVGGQAVAAQEATQANVSSQQTSQAVTDQANQLQETNKVTVQIPETVGSSLNQATQENPAQESQLVEVEPAIQKEVVSQDISAPQAALPAEAGQEQTTEEQSNTAGDESTLTVENSHQIIDQVEPKSIQTAQEPAGSTDEVTQPVQPTETAAVEEVVQPVRRSARRARSVATQELAKLPLDANGKLVTSLTNQSAVKLQTVFADGTSQIEEANAANLPRIKNGQNISELVSAVSPELKAVDYESLYEHLNHSERPLEKILLEQALKKENGGKALTDEEMSQRKRQVYMDQLDMRDSFNVVQTNLDSILAGVFEKTTTVDANTIKANKEKILLGLTYLDRQYGFQFGNFSAKDLILYHPEVFGNSSEPLTNLLAIGDLAYADLELRNNLVTYQRKLSSITNHADAIQFIESQVPRWTGQEDVSAWFKDTSKAYIVEASSPHGQTKLYTTLRDSQRWQNHILPLLNLSDDSLYAISTTNTITYGAVDTYLAEKNDSNRAALKTTIADYATHQQAFLDFWYRISEQSERLKTYEPIIVTDSLQAYSTGKASAEQLWSPKSGPKALTGVQEFIGPMNLYINFVRAGGQANGTNSMNNFLYKSLTNDGHAVYTHELTHMLDKTVWLNGHSRRPDQLQEVFARGLFESLNMSASPTSDPIFNLNTAYTISGDRTQNGHPSRFQTSTDLKTYMQGMLDVLYTLDYAEAQSILKKAPDERAVLLNKISLIPNPANNGGGKTTEIVNSIDTTSAANLQTIADFVDQGLISGRYKFNGMETRGTARTNSYYTIPLFEPIYAALQNDSGSGGDISFKRNAYEILGEYGYEKGMVAYLSDQYANDKEALAAIMPEFDGNLATFKKAMFNRRIAKVSELKPTSVASDFIAIQTKMDEAIAKDLQQLKVNANNNVLLSTGVNAVRELKNQIFQAYLKDTNEFRTSIYSESKARELYVTNGAENSTDGQGTETNPYQSLFYALSQAKDGDTIKLVSDVQHRQETPFLINKAVTIDGQGHRLTFRGPNVELGNDVTFANMTLNMIVDASQQATIYANGYHLTFDRVSTTISQAQSNLRPSLVAGSRTGDPAGSHGQITITNGSSDTRFNTIYAGNADSTSSIPVTISILSDFVSADNGIILSGANGALVEGPVAVISKSSSLKSIDGSASLDNTVTIDTARVYGLNLQNIQSLSLVNRADVTLSEQVSEISTGVELASGTQLIIANAPVTLGNLSGQGKVIVPATASLAVTGSIEGTVEVLVRGFEYNLSPHVDKVFVTAEGGFADTVRIALENQSDRFSLSNEGISYRLTEPTQTPKDIQVQLRFKDGERVVKEESLTLPAGSSVTDLGDRLPQLDLGHYEISSSFDQTQLNNLQTSQIIDIPLELITPALPVKVFDKTAVTGLELVILPTKTDYRPAETVDLAGLQVKLVDNQGLSRTISSDQFGEYGVEVVPVTLTPQVTRLQVRKDTHEVAIPIRVTPWKADVYAVTVGEKHVYETDDNLTAVETAILAKVQVDAQAGSVEKSFVNPLPTTLGEHNVPVLVRFDDGSQKRVEVAVEVVPANLQINLRFKEGERVVKEESLTLPVGSSVTDLGDRLPQLDLGHYVIASSFDQTQLNNLQTSKTIEIPLELVTPVKVFDKTAVTGLELVILPTKTDYRPAETVDLSGLQVKLVDNQGLSKTITPDQFNEYGVEVVSVTLTPQVTRLQVRKDTYEVAIPIQVIPWKADVYSVYVGDKHVYETDDNLTAVETALLAKVQVDAQAGSVEKGLVNPLPTTLGEHSVPVLVKYDDGSQKRVEVTVLVVPASLQVQLRFKEGERLVKEESLTLPVGSSVTDLGDRLPQLDLGHYEISSSFDQTQLNNLQTSQIIDIPLELITPALPVKVFDKTAITALELVTSPTKLDYRPADKIDLAGLQVKLVDNQGLSKTIIPDQFGEYGVELVPVTLTLQVTSLQVRKDTHEVTIPIRVIPWKADVYAVTVGEKHVYETDDDLSVVGNALLANVQVDTQAGPVEKGLVNPLPTTLGEHNVPVLVRFDDGSQKRVSIQVVVQQTAHGEGVTHELPIGVLPKSDRYQPQVTGEARVLPTSSTEEIKAEIVKQISLPTEAGQVVYELVSNLPQTNGDYPITVRVIYDDLSQEELEVPLHILTIKNGEVVKHSLPEGVLPKSDRYQPQVTSEARVLPTSSTEEIKAEIVKQISLPTEAGQVVYELVSNLPQTNGDYPITVRVIYDDRSQDEIVVPLHIFKMENGKGVTHELPVGVLPKSDRYQPQVTSEARVLPNSSTEEIKAEIVKQISLPTEAGQVVYELVSNLPQTNGDYPITVRVIYDDRSQDEIVVPLHIFEMENGKGVTDELPIGVLPKSDRYQPQVTGEARVLPASSSDDATAEIVKQISLPTEAGQVVYELVSNLPQTNGDYPITVRVIYDDRSQDEIVVPLHIFKMENGKGVQHELPVGVLPPLETTKDDGVTHELPIGVLPSLEVALEKGLGENSPKPAAKEMAVSVSVVGQQKFAKGQLPKTGDRNNLLLVGVMLAIFSLIFWMPGKKPHQVEEK
ncbi:ZmpA/ZmpB/ZmpC family metallo-endopeptidase [Streptococcus suis]|uniref:ZmpA/ZmpB/ZmpC family metallo-endopeptidase n=2 Tax=Streptococcus suis TaxID=1307 RepID=UPI0024126ED8|nr:ZmpA/ZmpB/ZmpC family metallo-endopeptidase [Streptococcus suis]MDG4510557.1 Rib/alpha-like domain-containing protein [Streptococcus suis]